MRLDAASLDQSLTVTVVHTVPAAWPRAGDTAQAHCTAFQSAEYLEAWLASFGATRRFNPCFVTVSAVGRPVLLLPLCIERRRGVRILSFIDQGQSDYNAPVLFDSTPDWSEVEVRAVWKHVLAALPPVDVVRLAKFPEMVGRRRNPLCLLTTWPEAASCHGNRLDQPWETVEAHLNSPREVRKKERALARVSPPRLLVAEGEEQRQLLLDQLIVQKQRRFVETKVPGFSEQPAALRFLKQATDRFAAAGHLLLVALMVGDNIAAIQWGVVHDKTFYALVTSYSDGPLAQYSCGRILNYRLIKLLHERGFAYFDQGYGDEAYKLRNADTTIALYCDEVALTARGRVFLFNDRIAKWARDSRLGTLVRSIRWTLSNQLGLRKIPTA
jgi:CelD/BcsL family acetyltransferase involved in cellulose biosynthesis